MEEDPAKDTAKQQKENPAVSDVPVNPRVDMEQASDFWKDVIDGMAAFEIDIEREHKRHLQARQARLQQARTQQEAFWTRFRNTPRYYQLMRQRQDAAHAFRAHIKKTRDEATSQGTTFQPASFRQFAAETNHPALQDIHPQTRRTAVSPRNVSYADQVAQQYCRRCGWKEAFTKKPLLYPPISKITTQNGMEKWQEKEGYIVEMSHTGDMCPKYKTESPYRCHRCANMGITAFHTIAECAGVTNPHNTANLNCLLVDENGDVYTEEELDAIPKN